MTRAEALSWGYCPRCASYAEAHSDAPARQGCARGRSDDACHIDPAYGEWLRVTFGLRGPRLAEDLGAFEGLRPRRAA